MQLVNQLPPPYIILGDFNAKHQLWGNDRTDERGQVIEQFINATNICILNTGQHTYFHVANGSSSAIDLSLCSPDVVDVLN